ncbi:hypothetical protein PCL_11507 [Purpureocillium lilacinum]|uniref:Transcriptional adapter 2 n=2 Tax=Purpureocillium lilacinum TaxID=33203 RepID=A0A2U3EA87_PURLI|nr:hypothetical protein PCL_11507 [Purpureocillium lilacinum]
MSALSSASAHGMVQQRLAGLPLHPAFACPKPLQAKRWPALVSGPNRKRAPSTVGLASFPSPASGAVAHWRLNHRIATLRQISDYKRPARARDSIELIASLLHFHQNTRRIALSGRGPPCSPRDRGRVPAPTSPTPRRRREMGVIRKKTVTRGGEGGVKYVCDVCSSDITSTVRIRCADPACSDFDLCVSCFAKGESRNTHDPATHAFRVIEQNSFPIFDREWGADEELLLLEGAETYGLGSWADIADHIGGFREKDEVRDHYLATYVDSPKFPLPKRCSPHDCELANEVPREEFQARKKRRIEDRREAAKNAPALQPKTKPTASVPSCHEIQGYMPGRLEFETEYANEAEEAVQHMQFDPGDGVNPRTGELEPEMELKLTVMEIYNSRLTQRVERKKVIFEHDLLEYRENTKVEKRRSKDEKDLLQKAKPFARIMNHKDFEDLNQGLIDELNLRQAITQLQEWRNMRIGDLKSGEKYETEKSQRIQKAIPMGSMDRERMASNQRSKQAPPPDPPSGAALLVAPELAIRPAPQTNGEVNGDSKPLTNGHTNGVNGVNGHAPSRPKITPQAISGVQPLQLSQDNAPDLHLLTPEEAKLCEVVRLQPKPYLMIKEQILKEALKTNGTLKKKQAKEICRLDSQKGARIFDFFINAGWLVAASHPNIHRDRNDTHLNARVKHPWPMFISRALKTASTATTTTSRAMSSVNIHTLQRMTAKTLSEKLLHEREAANPTFAVIDEHADYIGGHIRGSTNVPSTQLDAMMPTLVRKLKDKDAVVFHCALSQQRGPSAALRYLRERDGLLKSLGETRARPDQPQAVYVLDRGFSGWQEVYGTDERLTEGSRDGDPVQKGTTDTAGTVTSADAMVTASTADATGMADMWATSSRQDPRACPHVSLTPSATTSIKESAHSGDACASPRHIELTLHQQDSKLNLEAAGPQPNQCLKVQRRGILLCATGVSPAWAVHQTTYNPLPVVIPLCYSFSMAPLSTLRNYPHSVALFRRIDLSAPSLDSAGAIACLVVGGAVVVFFTCTSIHSLKPVVSRLVPRGFFAWLSRGWKRLFGRRSANNDPRCACAAGGGSRQRRDGQAQEVEMGTPRVIHGPFPGAPHTGGYEATVHPPVRDAGPVRGTSIYSEIPRYEDLLPVTPPGVPPPVYRGWAWAQMLQDAVLELEVQSPSRRGRSRGQGSRRRTGPLFPYHVPPCPAALARPVRRTTRGSPADNNDRWLQWRVWHQEALRMRQSRLTDDVVNDRYRAMDV